MLVISVVFREQRRLVRPTLFVTGRPLNHSPVMWQTLFSCFLSLLQMKD